MISKFTKPSKSVSGNLLPKNDKQPLFLSARNQKANRLSKAFKVLALSICTSLVVQCASAQLNLNFGTNYTLKSGTDKQQGAIYLYSKVNDSLDCIVTISLLYNGATLTSFDDNTLTYGGEAARFQPIIAVPKNSKNNSSYAKFNFQLIKTGTYSGGTGTKVIPSDPLWFRAYDIDGNGVSNNDGVREFVEVTNVFTGTWVDAPTQLVAKTPTITTGGSSYTISNSSINGGNLSDYHTMAFNGFVYANTVSSWDIIGGATVGGTSPSVTGNPTNIGDGDRLNSWSFNYTEVIPGVDFGDAPSSYSTGATPIVPAFHLVPSDASNITVYLGSVKPDVDYDPSGNASATTDDKNNPIDDEDGFQSTYFPKYSGSGAYTCTISATNTSGADAYIYGYIDFDGSGVFNNATERSSMATVHSTSTAVLQYITVTFPVGFNFTASNNRYARFRIGSVPTEVATPNGKASNGEVEDYHFNTAIKITGTDYDDANGTTDSKINGTATGSAGATQLFAVLVDTANKVLQSVAIPSNGIYTLDSAGTYNTFKVVLSSTNLTIGSTYSSNALPAAYVYTSAGITSITPAGNGLSTGNFTVTTGSGDVSTMDFGWDALPQTLNESAAINNPNSSTKYPLTTAPLSGTDPEVTGTISTGGSFIINPVSTGATLYYNGTAVTASTLITNYTPALLTILFSANGTKTFTYSTVDAAGKSDLTPATYTVTLSSILPLNDIVLSANEQGGTVKLTLVAKDENNVARYTWEQSTDGATFTTIGSVVYQTTATNSNVYTFTNTPTGTSNVVYYRSVQYSLDGSSLASNVVVVKLNDKSLSQAIVMPTIIKDIANIKVSSANGGTLNLNIMDNMGRMMMMKQINISSGSNTFAIDGFSKLANGAYYIQLSGIDNQSVLKVIVQH